MMYYERDKSITLEHRQLAQQVIQTYLSKFDPADTARHFGIKLSYVPFAADLRLRKKNNKPICPAWAIACIVKKSGLNLA